MTRVALYHRTSAADAGTPPGAAVDELRRYAAHREWTICGEHLDHHPRPDGPRPALAQLAGRVATGEVDVVLVASLHRLFRDLRAMVLTGREWVRRGVALVALEENLDGTSAAGRLLLHDTLRLMDALEHQRHSEATRCGMVLRGLAETGGIRPRVPVNLLEIKELYEQGARGRYLSLRGIVTEVKRTGGRLSDGTLNRALAELREAGMLDETKRDALRQRAGANRGGRPAVRLVYDPAEIATLLARGYGAERIRKAATSLPRRTTVWQVRRIVAQLRAAAAQQRADSSKAPGTPARERAQPKGPEGGGGSRISATGEPGPAAAPGPRRRCLRCLRELEPHVLACPSCSSPLARDSNP